MDVRYVLLLRRNYLQPSKNGRRYDDHVRRLRTVRGFRVGDAMFRLCFFFFFFFHHDYIKKKDININLKISSLAYFCIYLNVIKYSGYAIPEL